MTFPMSRGLLLDAIPLSPVFTASAVEMTFPMSRGLLHGGIQDVNFPFAHAHVEMTFPMSRGLLRLQHEVHHHRIAAVEMTFPMSRGLLQVLDVKTGVVGHFDKWK